MRSGDSTSTSRCSSGPAADGRNCGGPTIDAWRPVRRAERVVHVEVLALDQLLHERRVVGLLARVEAQVLEQLDAGRQLGQHACGPGSIEYFGSGLPFGRPRWVHAVTVGALLGSHSMVGSAARMRKSSTIAPSRDRDVEVGAEQDPATVDVAEVLERREPTRRYLFAAPTISARSTRRFE